jgi:membrane protein implicated in regulation of membrane protease activity
MGFMHAGIAGVVLYGVLVGFIFRIIDSLRGASLPNWLIVAALVAPVRSMLFSTDLFTALLTHGLAFGFLLLILARAGKNGTSLTSETDNNQCKKNKQI